MSEKLNNWLAEKVMGWHKESPNGISWAWCRLDGTIAYDVDLWNPTKDRHQTMMCLNKALDADWFVDISFCAGKVKLLQNGKLVTTQEFIDDSDLPLAICESIKQAIEAK